MSKWTEEFNANPLIGVWESLLEVINSDELEAQANESSIEDVARLKKVISYLNGIFENIDPELTPKNRLANIKDTASKCQIELNNFIGNGNQGHLKNANDHADQLLILFQQLPAAIYSVSPENIKSAVESYSKTIGSYISKYRIETENHVEELVNRIDDINQKLRDQENQISDLASEITTAEQTIQKQISEFNTQYQSSEKTRTEKFEQLSTKLSDKADNVFQDLSTKSAKIVEVLVNLQDDARQVYDVTVNTLQGGAYSSYANEERKVANKYRIFASLLMMIGVSFLVVPELIAITNLKNYTFDWLRVLGRVPLSLVVFVPAFYFARESGKHRNTEVINRRRQHILTTLDPYLALMEPARAQELKSHVAKTVFSESITTDAPDKDTVNLISQLANLAKQIKS